MLFLSSFTNRIDKKSRVSVPAGFRAVLARQEGSALIAYASLQHPCIEACGMERFGKMNARLEAMDPFSPERDALAALLFGESVQLGLDTEGRVLLPEPLLKAAGIGGEAVFVGKGEFFEIWSPPAYAAYAKAARALVKQTFYGGKKS